MRDKTIIETPVMSEGIVHKTLAEIREMENRGEVYAPRPDAEEIDVLDTGNFTPK